MWYALEISLEVQRGPGQHIFKNSPKGQAQNIHSQEENGLI